jgi:hypothetical protein
MEQARAEREEQARQQEAARRVIGRMQHAGQARAFEQWAMRAEQERKARARAEELALLEAAHKEALDAERLRLAAAEEEARARVAELEESHEALREEVVSPRPLTLNTDPGYKP